MKYEIHKVVSASPHDFARPCILMFSGGRDSSLAAVRLRQRGLGLTLVTVSSSHLNGIDSVRRRLRELSKILPPDTQWVRINQPEDLRTEMSFYAKTCLPCHHAYVVVAVAVALAVRADALAFGYASYQSSWPEQTPFAIKRLEAVLERYGVRLLLPVYDVCSRDEAIRQLAALGLSDASLEQKCVRQLENVELSNEQLVAQVSFWESAIEASVSKLSLIEVNTIESATLAGF